MSLGSRVLPPPKARLTPPQGLTLGNFWQVVTDYTMWSMLQSTSKWHIATIATPRSGFGKSMAPLFFRRILRYFHCLSLWGWQKTSFSSGWRQAQHNTSWACHDVRRRSRDVEEVPREEAFQCCTQCWTWRFCAGKNNGTIPGGISSYIAMCACQRRW